jgi:hypothetical protein
MKKYSPALTEYYNTKREIDHHLARLRSKPHQHSAVERHFERLENERQQQTYDTLNRLGYTPDQIQSELALMGKSKELALDAQQNRALNQAIKSAVPSASDILRDYNDKTGLSLYEILHGKRPNPTQGIETKIDELVTELKSQENNKSMMTDQLFADLRKTERALEAEQGRADLFAGAHKAATNELAGIKEMRSLAGLKAAQTRRANDAMRRVGGEIGGTGAEAAGGAGRLATAAAEEEYASASGYGTSPSSKGGRGGGVRGGRGGRGRL